MSAKKNCTLFCFSLLPYPTHASARGFSRVPQWQRRPYFFLGPYDPNWLQNYKIRTPLVNPFNISYPFLALFLSFVALPPSLLPSSPLPLLAL